MRILYVEDNPANLFLVQRVARMGNHEVLNYTTGETALENFERDHPDMVLMDVQLAGNMTGLDVVRKLRGSGYKTPIIAVTAYAMIGDRERCMDAGCDDYLAKPLPVPMLVEIIKRYDPQQQDDALDGVGQLTQPNRPTTEIPKPAVPYPATPPDRESFKLAVEATPQVPATPATPETSAVEGTKDDTIASAAALEAKKTESTPVVEAKKDDSVAVVPAVEAKKDDSAAPAIEAKKDDSVAVTPPVEAKKEDSTPPVESKMSETPTPAAPEATVSVPPAPTAAPSPTAPVSGMKYDLEELETDPESDAKTEPFKPVNVPAKKED